MTDAPVTSRSIKVSVPIADTKGGAALAGG